MVINTPIDVKECQVIPTVLEMADFDQKGLLELCCVGSPPTPSLPLLKLTSFGRELSVLGALSRGAPFLSYTKSSYTSLIVC